MNPDFLKDVQAAGWHIERVTDSDVIARCPSIGCDLAAKLEPSQDIPQVGPGCRIAATDRKVEKYDDIRRILRARRESLALSIREVEEISGMAVDHLAKIERDDYTKQPNGQMLIEWAQALGFEIVLRPIDLTPYAVRMICDTRDRHAARTKRFSLEARRRGVR